MEEVEVCRALFLERRGERRRREGGGRNGEEEIKLKDVAQSRR